MTFQSADDRASPGSTGRAPILTVTLNAAVDLTLAVPTLEAGGSYTATQALRLAGGKGLNVARVLHGLGMPVVATGLAGGATGAIVEQGLADEGIASRFMPIAAPSRICTAIIELDRHRATEVNEPGPLVTPDEARAFLDFFAAVVTDATAVALCGSLPRGLPDDFYAELSERALAAEVPVVLDTSGRALAPGIAALPLVVKINAREASAVLGLEIHEPVDALRAGRQLRQRGAQAVVVTLGAAGAVLVHETGSWHAHLPPRRVLSTVGCGDAFTAGYVTAVCGGVANGEAPSFDTAARRQDVAVRALILGTACGAANALTLGAGKLTPAEVERLQREVAVVPPG